MANPTRILFVSDEVAPFTGVSATADLVRLLPEQLQESGDYEVRIMMPRYGTISERRNRLHEVIRLSGTDVDMNTRSETLKVKVASIPGIRLQVYFMDNNHYFKRKGVYADKQGKLFEDNAERGLYFCRAALETIRNLGWAPDVVHAFGWMSGFAPMLLRTEFAGDPLFENVKTVYTPIPLDSAAALSESFVKSMNLSEDGQIKGIEPTEVGLRYADAAIYPATTEPGSAEGFQFESDPSDMITVAAAAYEQVLNEVPA